LIVSPVVIRELNRHKDSPTSIKTRERATAALSKLHEWSDRLSPIFIRNSVQLQFQVQDPTIDFEAFNLSRDIADDHLIASILEYRSESGQDRTALVTADLGLKLKARTQHIPVIQLKSSLRLPEELLPEEKRLRELESEVRRLRYRVPVVKLVFDTGKVFLRIAFTGSEQPNPESSVASGTAMRAKYPKMEVPRDDGQSNSDFSFFISLNTIASEDIIKYNQQLDIFYAAYDQYVSKLDHFHAFMQRTARLNIVVLNEGTCPAEDIDVFLHFPDGFVLLTEKTLPRSPSRPEPPPKPQTPAEKATAVLQRSAYMPSFSGNSNLGITLPTPTNVSEPRIRRTKSYDVEVSIATLKHGFKEQLDPLYLVFDSGASASSFTIDYAIHASNLPDALNGQLHVIIENHG
jgi:hypothetical protein